MTTDKNNSPVTAPMWWDGGDRAITAREKATIEEHGPSCYAIPLLPAQAVNPEDPWRGLYLPARMPAPSDYGDLLHPDIPSWPDDREDALDKLVHAQGFDFQIVAGEFSEAALDDGDELYWQEMRAWNPEAPEGEWRLAWKGDTEDGPYAWFVRPMALRPEPAALAAQPSPADQGAVPCATSASHGLRVAYRHLDMVSMRVSHCKDAAIIESAMKDVDTFDLNAATSALAARQPGAQERAWLIHWSHIPLEAPEATTSASRVDAVSALTDPPRIEPLYAAPPAQCIDMGQFIALAKFGEEFAFSAEKQPHSRVVYSQANRLLALIDQRDAAPGVSP